MNALREECRQLRDELLERLAERLFKRRVRAHGCQQLAGRHAVGNGLPQLPDDVAGVGTHQLRPQNGPGLGVGRDLHEAPAGVCDHGPGVAAHDALEGRAEGDLCFADAHVAAEQPIHGHGFLHIGLDLPDGGQLIVGLRIVEGLLKFLLPGGIR